MQLVGLPLPVVAGARKIELQLRSSSGCMCRMLVTNTTVAAVGLLAEGPDLTPALQLPG